MGKTSLKKFLIFFITFLFLFVNQNHSLGSASTINRKHKKFYRYGSVVDFNRILQFKRQSINRVVSVTINYNMVYSNLDVVWMYNGQEVHSESLSKGLDQSASFTYNQVYPGDFSLKVVGNQGQIQVVSVSALIDSQLKLKKKVQTFKQVKFFKIVSPDAGQNWEMNKAATIHWSSSGIRGKLACELFKDRNKVRLLSRNIPVNSRSYRFQVTGNDIMPGRNYQIRLTTLSDRKSYVSKPFNITDEFQPAILKKYTLQLKTQKTGKMDIAASKPVKLRVISPKYQEKWHLLEEYSIQWESEGLTKNDDIAIALRQISGKSTKIITITKNTGEYRFKVPYPHIFMAFDVQVIITPLRDRSVEARSDPFVIMRPMVDLIPNTPSVSFQFPKKRKRKWWERVGDVLSGGVTWVVNEAVEIDNMKKVGTIMTVDLNVFNKGLMTRKKVWVDCSIQTSWGNVLYSFEKQQIPVVYVDLAAPVSFSGRTKGMNLEKGRYTLEVFIDPDNKTAEPEPFRKNNRLKIEFDVK